MVACSSPRSIGMVLAHPQRPAAYSALRLLVHSSASFPLGYLIRRTNRRTFNPQVEHPQGRFKEIGGAMKHNVRSSAKYILQSVLQQCLFRTARSTLHPFLELLNGDLMLDGWC